MTRPRTTRYDRGTAAEYNPLAVVNRDVLKVLMTPHTWPQLKRLPRRESFLREQVFAFDWLGFARWSDPNPVYERDNNRGSLSGTWSITDAGRTFLGQGV